MKRGRNSNDTKTLEALQNQLDAANATIDRLTDELEHVKARLDTEKRENHANFAKYNAMRQAVETIANALARRD